MKSHGLTTPLCLALLGTLCLSCSTKKGAGAEALEVPAVKLRTVDGGTFALPKATAFRMSGDYASNVGVTLNPDGSLAYYPDPADISIYSAPLAIGDGWWLNRQGISSGSVFTKWTFEEYAALPSVPSREEIISAVIPGAVVTEMVTLPFTLTEAASDPAACLQFCITDY